MLKKYRNALLFGAVALMIFAMVASSKSKSESAQIFANEPGERVEKYLPGGYQLFRADGFKFSFHCPGDWSIQQEPFNEIDGSLQTILVEGKANETVAIKIFNRPWNIERFIKENVGAFATSDVKDIEATKSVISGCDGYSWITKDRGKVIGGTLVFANENFLFVFNFTAAENSELGAIDEIIYSLSAGLQGPNNLTFNLLEQEYPELSDILVPNCCNLTDDYENTFPCSVICTNSNPECGNCTWYCEYRTQGHKNFRGYGDAYMWFFNAKFNGTKVYPIGGTIPEEGAIMVFEKTVSPYTKAGHVAYINSVSSDGSINVTEQGWEVFCTRDYSYSTVALRSYLAGYIYVDGSIPEPTAKSCSGASIGTSTIINAFNFSNTYNFQTYGPGRKYSHPDGYGWGTYNGGNNNFFYWTTTIERDEYLSYGKWKFTVTNTGFYELQAYIPYIHGTADNARYRVAGILSNSINQNNYADVFVKIVNPDRADGTWYLASGTNYEVKLEDNNAGTAGKELAMDAIKVIKSGSLRRGGSKIVEPK